MSAEYKLVPVEPTIEMMHAGCDCANTRTKWQAMVHAAQATPQPTYDCTSDRLLIEQIISKRGWPTEKVDGFYADYRAHHAWSVCMEFAQSRDKAGEVGHE